jgi:hypothetical protein
VRRYPRPSAWLIPLWAGLVNCAEPLRAPSAFSEERFLCDTPDFAALMAECRDGYLRDGSCLGWLSFHGTIDAQQVVVDSPATKVIPAGPPAATGVPDTGMQVYGSAPYFNFRISIHDPAMPSPASAGSGGGAGAIAMSNVDFMNIEARGGNYLASWVHETRQVQIVAADEVGFSFATDLLRGGHIEGCLNVFLGNKP